MKRRFPLTPSVCTPLTALLLFAGLVGGSAGCSDAGRIAEEDSGPVDGGIGDSVTADSAPADSVSVDTGIDTAVTDSGTVDSTASDTATSDTTTPDTTAADTTTTDTGGATDTGVVDTGTDSGTSTGAIAAYAWANEPSSASYTPSATYSYNSAGGAITITRSGAGTYAVNFASLAVSSGDVQVTSYNSSARCNVTNWGGSAVNVACRNSSGTAVDSMFTIAVVLNGVTSAAKPVAYAWANTSSSASYTPSAAYSYNAGGGAITATRSAAGTYAITFAGLTINSGNIQVSAYNSTAECNVASWSGSTVNVRCYSNSGALVDSMYTVLVILNGVSTTASVRSYAWTDQATAASYTPSAGYSWNSGGGAITATRSAAGTYAITFGGLALSAGTIKVSSYGSANYCNVTSWGGSANVRCLDSSGANADSRYTILVVQ